MPNFKNTPNELITSTDGREFWISRSVAVAVVVIAICQGKPHVLLNKRGKGAPDFQGFWNCPCGYLDWNESSGEAAVREVFEETGFDIENFYYENASRVYSCVVYNGIQTPWGVETNPASSNRQNVTIRHSFVFNCEELPTLSNEHNEKDETADIRWVPLNEILYGDMEFAFNHKELINLFVNKISYIYEVYNWKAI